MPIFDFLLGTPDIHHLQTKSDVKGIIRALSFHKDAQIRTEAAWALGALKDARALHPLLQSINDPKKTVCQASVEALGQLGQPDAIAPLAILFKDRIQSSSDTPIRLSEIPYLKIILKALGEIGGEKGADALVECLASLFLWRTWETERKQFEELISVLLQKIGPPAVPSLIRGMEIQENRFLFFLEHLLGEFGPEIFPQLTEALNQAQDIRIFASIARIMNATDKERSEPILREAMTNPRLHLWAINNLPVPPSQQTIDRLLLDLHNKNFEIRTSALLKLSFGNDPRLFQAFKVCLKDEDKLVRAGAVQALGRLGDLRAVDDLIPCLHDQKLIREYTTLTLVKLGALDPLIDALQDPSGDRDGPYRMEMIGPLGTCGNPCILEVFELLLKEHNLPLTIKMVNAIGNLDAGKMLDFFEKILRDAQYSPEVKITVVNRLESLDHPRTGSLLLSILQEEHLDDNLRWTVIYALRKIGDSRLAEALVQIIEQAEKQEILLLHTRLKSVIVEIDDLWKLLEKAEALVPPLTVDYESDDYFEKNRQRTNQVDEMTRQILGLEIKPIREQYNVKNKERRDIQQQISNYDNKINHPPTHPQAQKALQILQDLTKEKIIRAEDWRRWLETR